MFIDLVEMEHIFKFTIKQIHRLLNGKPIVVIHQIVSILVKPFYSMFEMPIGLSVLSTIFYFQVELHLVIYFVLQNQIQLQVIF